MNMPKDTKGAHPEDVEAHMPFRRDVQGEEPGARWDTSDDVEAHGRYYNAGEEEDVEAHRRHFFDTDQAGTDEDVEGHGAPQRPRPEDGEGDDVEGHRLSR